MTDLGGSTAKTVSCISQMNYNYMATEQKAEGPPILESEWLSFRINYLERMMSP